MKEMRKETDGTSVFLYGAILCFFSFISLKEMLLQTFSFYMNAYWPDGLKPKRATLCPLDRSLGLVSILWSGHMNAFIKKKRIVFVKEEIKIVFFIKYFLLMSRLLGP